MKSIEEIGKRASIRGERAADPRIDLIVRKDDDGMFRVYNGSGEDLEVSAGSLADVDAAIEMAWGSGWDLVWETDEPPAHLAAALTPEESPEEAETRKSLEASAAVFREAAKRLKIDIEGAGPTGVVVVVEINGQAQVRIYDEYDEVALNWREARSVAEEMSEVKDDDGFWERLADVEDSDPAFNG